MPSAVKLVKGYNKVLMPPQYTGLMIWSVMTTPEVRPLDLCPTSTVQNWEAVTSTCALCWVAQVEMCVSHETGACGSVDQHWKSQGPPQKSGCCGTRVQGAAGFSQPKAGLRPSAAPLNASPVPPTLHFASECPNSGASDPKRANQHAVFPRCFWRCWAPVDPMYSSYKHSQEVTRSPG